MEVNKIMNKTWKLAQDEKYKKIWKTSDSNEEIKIEVTT